MRGGFNIEKRNKLLERFELDPRKKCRTYSKGNRQKVALVSAFSSSAELFIFDEPTSGLDPLMAAVFQQCVAELKKAGKTVLMSSHILAEVEAVCDKVSIIRNGEIIESGTLTELRHFTRTVVEVETKKPIIGLEGMTGLHNLCVEGTRANFQVDTGELDRIMQHVGIGFPMAGSLALGLVVGSAVWIATAMAAVAAQLTDNSGVASMSAFWPFLWFSLCSRY